METLPCEDGDEKRSRLCRVLGHLAERIGQPYTDESHWVMETGEGVAIAAGAKDLEGVDLDAAFEGFSDKLATVLRRQGIEQ